MEPYANLIIPDLTGDLRNDVRDFLIQNGHDDTAQHCLKVGEEARRIAERFNAPAEAALHAGYLHDISAVFPNEVRIEVARALGIEVLPEEEVFPMIIHQKLSERMAYDIFHIRDEEILNAVGCHTTLRKDSTRLDRVLFVADKIAWDQEGRPPYIQELLTKLEISLEHAAFEYIQFLWDQRNKLKVLHPWLADAYYELKINCEATTKHLSSVQAVFIDRDGTIGGTGHFIHPNDFTLYPNAQEAIDLLKRSGLKVFAITNQHRISRGQATIKEFEDQFKEFGFDQAYICPHELECNCRKPKPGMLLEAAEQHNLDLTKCIVIGDVGSTDMLAAHAVGAKKIIVRTGWGEGSLSKYKDKWAEAIPDYIAVDILDAVNWILKNSCDYSS